MREQFALHMKHCTSDLGEKHTGSRLGADLVLRIDREAGELVIRGRNGRSVFGVHCLAGEFNYIDSDRWTFTGKRYNEGCGFHWFYNMQFDGPDNWQLRHGVVVDKEQNPELAESMRATTDKYGWSAVWGDWPDVS